MITKKELESMDSFLKVVNSAYLFKKQNRICEDVSATITESIHTKCSVESFSQVSRNKFAAV